MDQTKNGPEINQKDKPSPVNELLNKRQLLVKKVVILGVIVLFLIAGVVAYFRYRPSSSAQSNNSTQNNDLPNVSVNPIAEPQILSSLDGTLVNSSVANRRPLAIMVENHPESRPQSGLSQASVIYEALAEGGITRFMAIFGPNSASKIGPVRSARAYYLDWALEYDAAYAHVGGNRNALDLIPSLKIHDLDQFAFGEQAFWREPQSGKALEHTMYTNSDKLWALADVKFGKEQNWTKSSFKEPIARDHRPISQTVSIDFSSASFKVGWQYDPESNTYLRTLAGAFHKDAETNETLRAANIFVQEVVNRPTTTRIGESTLEMDTVGSGEATVFQEGKKIQATWKKESQAASTKFYDAEDKEIARLPGVTWIEVVTPGTTVTAD